MKTLFVVACLVIAASVSGIAAAASGLPPSRYFTRGATVTWRLQISHDGSFELLRQTATNPGSGDAAPGDWKSTGGQGSRPDTNGLCAGRYAVGLYSWHLAGRALTLHPLRDACSPRKALFANEFTRFF